MRLYPKNSEKELSAELFKNPTSEYRGTPFWSWNCKLDKEKLLHQIDMLKQMGMGGFHIHSRTGMATPYLSEEFMALVRACDEKAKQEGMLCWLYDEDRWPSGAAGGIVTKDKRFRARYLLFTGQPQDEGRFLAKYEIDLRNGCLKGYRRLKREEEAENGRPVWHAYIKLSDESPWYNNQTYVNTLDRKAIERFIEVTHESYYREFGNEFGRSIPAIFTDEPQFSRKETFKFAEEGKSVTLPFTDDFPDTYKECYKEDILDRLPELFWELPDGAVSLSRYRYHEHLSERFADAFADTVGKWCGKHGIMLTGHMMEEPTLESQTHALGEAMRSYRSFHLPGIDILCDRHEYTTAKQAQSAAHQYGREGVLSELYGVTNWDFGFIGHKLQGDWQAALGVTVRVHHLTWVSMNGEAKRDYPASIGYQSPWYKEYPMIEDYFSRVNTALTRGNPHVRIGVIHPIESYWLYWGPTEQTFEMRQQLETGFKNITQWLLFGLLDFDFIAESLLPSLSAREQASGQFEVGRMKYDVVIVPGCHTLRSTTLERLETFREAGGKVIFAGAPARMVDAEASDRVKKFAEKCTAVPFEKKNILDELEQFSDIRIIDDKGVRTDNLLYQMRDDGSSKWLFICHAYNDRSEYSKTKKRDIPDFEAENVIIRVKGKWKPILYNAMDGTVARADAEIRGDETILRCSFYRHDSLLFRLDPGIPDALPAGSGKVPETGKEPETQKTILLEDPVPFTLSEPNTLLLDMAEYSFDGGDWRPEEEILRIDNAFRRELGFKPRSRDVVQPWAESGQERLTHKLGLKFAIDSEIEVKAPYLALENPQNTEITVNGEKVPAADEGWYVDEAIRKVRLPALKKGLNEIALYIPFGIKTNVEWCYLLGDFGTEVRGRHAKLVDLPGKLAFGDCTVQGLSFYGGNITYHCSFVADEDCFAEVQAPMFKNPVLSVALDGVKKGNIAFEPYSAALGYVRKGRHTLDITAFGSRINSFGTIHNCIKDFEWYGPNAWRTTGAGWSYEYRLRPVGILSAPRLRMRCAR